MSPSRRPDFYFRLSTFRFSSVPLWFTQFRLLLKPQFRFTVLFCSANKIRRTLQNLFRDVWWKVQKALRAVFVRDESQNHLLDTRIAAEKSVHALDRLHRQPLIRRSCCGRIHVQAVRTISAFPLSAFSFSPGSYPFSMHHNRWAA